MGQSFIPYLLWFAAIGCGVIAGLFFAFSTFIMTALKRVAPATGIASMNAINIVIVRSLFMPLFLSTTLAGLALAGAGVIQWGRPGALEMAVGGVTYVVGMFIVTMVFNVPLNNALAAVDPDSSEGAALWARYLKTWTRWNHVRTVASLVGAVGFTLALVAR